MVGTQPVEVGRERTPKFRAILHVEDVIDELKIELALTRKAAAGIAPNVDLFVRHYLNARLLRRRKQKGFRVHRNGPVHQRLLGVELMEEECFEGIDGVLTLAGPRPHIGDLPNVNLTVCDDVATGARDVAAYTLANSI